MFKIFDRYIIREILPPFFIGLLISSFVLLMNQILLLSDLLISKGISLKAAIKIFVYLIPAILAFTVPMAILMGILGGMSRLSSDSEIVAFKTLGVSYKRLLRPVLLFSLGGWLLTSFITLYLAPRFNYKWVQTVAQSVLTKVQFDIKPREFNELIPNMVIFIQDITHERKWKSVFIHSSENPEEPEVFLAKNGKLNFYPELKRATIELFDGTLHSYPLDDPEKYSVTSFKELEHEVNVENLFNNFSKKKRVREKDIKELFEEVKHIRNDLTELKERRSQLLQEKTKEEDPQLIEVTSAIRRRNRDRISHWVEIHKKFAFPFVCLIFVFLGLPLGASTRKGGRTSGFTISLVIILIYYVFITWGETLAMNGKISPFLGIWGANIILLLTASYLYVKASKELPLFSRFASFFRKRKDTISYSPKKRKKVSSSWFRLSIAFPNILDRYIIRKYLAIFLLVFLAISLIFVIVTLIERLDDIHENNKPLGLAFEDVGYNLPAFIHYNILPTAILTATLLTLGLLTKFNEITAMKACGISIYRIIVPIILIAILASLFSFYLQENILPYTNKKREEAWNKINDIPPRSYTYLDRRWVLSREKDRIYHYSYFDPNEVVFSHLSLFDIDLSSWSLERRIYSEKSYLRDGNLTLENCWFRYFHEGKPERYGKRDKMNITPTEDRNFFVKEWKEPDQMSFTQLRRYIKDIEESGFETVKFKVDLYFKTSFPFVSLIMTILAIPFAFSMGKRGTLVGIGLSIGIAIVYWGTIGIFKSLGNIDFLPSLLAAWGPNILFGLIGGYFLFSLRT